MSLRLSTLERVASARFAKEAAIGVTKGADTGGVMIAWFPPEELAAQLAVPGYESADRLHVTLAYIGPDANDIDTNAVLAAAKMVAVNWYTMQGQLGGMGRFVSGEELGEDVFFLTVDVPELEALHERIEERLCEAGIWESSTHGFVPHMTLAYLDPAESNPAELMKPVPIVIDALSVVIAGERMDFKIGWQDQAAEVEGPADDAVYRATYVKSNDELRYTLGVMYAPQVKDAHDEYVSDDDLHAAVLDFMKNGDKRLKLQHDPTVDVGDIVEMMRWPYPVTVDVTRPGVGKDAEPITKTVTLPAGTVFMGVVWDERIWPYVKDGTIGGYSMGGRAVRVEGEDVPELGKDAMSTGDLSSVSVDQSGRRKKKPVEMPQPEATMKSEEPTWFKSMMDTMMALAKREPAPVNVTLPNIEPHIEVHTPDVKADFHVTVDSKPGATRTRVVTADEDGIATETITEPVED